MNFKLLVRPEVDADLLEAESWYEQQQSGLGREFLHAAREKMWSCMQFCMPPERTSIGNAGYKNIGATVVPEIDTFAKCNYCDHMTATLRETKAKLSEMVRLASQGEEVVITVHGKEVAKLVPVPSRERRVDREKWLKRLATLRKKTWTGRYGKTAQEIQDEDRADRI